MRCAYSLRMDSPAAAAVSRWHEAVNQRDLSMAQRAVTDPIVVSGPRGTGPVTAEQFAQWILNSGIELRPRSQHDISDRVVVVEQEARWPESANWVGVATVFRATGDRVSAALRFPDLATALAFATTYVELAATEA